MTLLVPIAFEDYLGNHLTTSVVLFHCPPRALATPSQYWISLTDLGSQVTYLGAHLFGFRFQTDDHVAQWASLEKDATGRHDRAIFSVSHPGFSKKNRV